MSVPFSSTLARASLAIVGTTSWGLGLALAMSKTGVGVTLLVRDELEAAELTRTRAHPRLPGAVLPANVAIDKVSESDLTRFRVLILAVPAQRMRENIRSLASSIPNSLLLVSAAKGLEQSSHLRMTEVIAEEIGDGRCTAVFSGPNLVPEVVAGLPAAAVLACTDAAIAAELQSMLASPQLRLYTSRDVIGVEIGGALKNVIALAAGLSEGLGQGDNAKAALITRGLAEIVRLGVTLGADAITFAGLSGLGDLIATCASPLSRNHRAGRLLATGITARDVEAEIGEVVEGIGTTAAAHALACEHGVAMPITEKLYQVLFCAMPPQKAAAALMQRDLTDEPPI